MRDMLRALKPASSPFATDQPASRSGSVRGAAVMLQHDAAAAPILAPLKILFRHVLHPGCACHGTLW